MADDNWYYAQNNQQLGPVPLATLRSMVASGQVSAADLVWTQGMSQWQPARSVPEVGSVLLSGGGGGGVGSTVASPTAYPPTGGAGGLGGAGRLGYGVGNTYYQQQYYHVEYAGFWLRFCAFFIDWIILVIPFVIIGFVIGMTNPQLFSPPAGGGPGVRATPTWTGIELAIRVAEIIVGWLYFALQESSARQATLGKLALGLKVTDIDGGRLSFGHATGRYFAKILSACTLYIGFIMAGFTEKKQGLHDMVAGTLVVKK